MIVREQCNGYIKQQYEEYVNFDSLTWKEEISDKVRWHVNCYASYVSPQNIKQSSFCSTDISMQIETIATRSQKPLINLKENCMFCTFKKHKKESRLVEVQYDDVIKKIEEQCNTIKDEELRLRIGGDFSKLPAFEARYHPGCYKSFFRTKKDREKSVHDICFELLRRDIDEVLASGRAIEVHVLLEKYQHYLRDNEYENYNAYTVQKLRNRIEQYYSELVCFTTESHKRQSLFSSKIEIADAINTAFKYKQMLKNKEILIDEPRNAIKQVLITATDILKSEIENVEGIKIHPLNPEDMTSDSIENAIPEALKSFLNALCNGSVEKTTKIMSIAQDIISLNSGGRKRMPKNVALAISLKNSLTSKEFITYLNSLGYSISYDDVLRIETTWANQILSSGDGYATIPSNIKVNYFTQAAL